MGLGAGDLTRLQTCISGARNELSEAPADEGPVASVLGLFVDWIERHLNID